VAQVLEMLEKGETPPGIRGDIVDTPPDPAAPPPPARLTPRLKPWERAASGPPPGACGAARPPAPLPHLLRAARPGLRCGRQACAAGFALERQPRPVPLARTHDRCGVRACARWARSGVAGGSRSGRRFRRRLPARLAGARRRRRAVRRRRRADHRAGRGGGRRARGARPLQRRWRAHACTTPPLNVCVASW